jgi:hypothetical protein
MIAEYDSLDRELREGLPKLFGEIARMASEAKKE